MNWRATFMQKSPNVFETSPESQSDCVSLSWSLFPEEGLSHLPWIPLEWLLISPLVGGDEP